MSVALPTAALSRPGLAGPVTGPATAPAGAPARSSGAGSFADVLASTAGGAAAPHFSRHALERLGQRAIDLDGPTVARLRDGIGRAATKGSRESVVFVDSTAFVVSVRNNTVITAVDARHMRQQVFTNIDSAVIA